MGVAAAVALVVGMVGMVQDTAASILGMAYLVVVWGSILYRTYLGEDVEGELDQMK